MSFSGSNYRNLVIEMLLNIRIKSPKELSNMTIGERFASINWKDHRISQLVQDQLYFGMHNNVCLAHGRVPIIPVRVRKILPYIIVTSKSKNITSIQHINLITLCIYHLVRRTLISKLFWRRLISNLKFYKHQKMYKTTNEKISDRRQLLYHQTIKTSCSGNRTTYRWKSLY